ncbi:MAG: hypothetical protein ACI8R6_000223 [Candidatus Paceibacteria bacterium]|jgi:hypothetical protein
MKRLSLVFLSAVSLTLVSCQTHSQNSGPKKKKGGWTVNLNLPAIADMVQINVDLGHGRRLYPHTTRYYSSNYGGGLRYYYYNARGQQLFVPKNHVHTHKIKVVHTRTPPHVKRTGGVQQKQSRPAPTKQVQSRSRSTSLQQSRAKARAMHDR